MGKWLSGPDPDFNFGHFFRPTVAFCGRSSQGMLCGECGNHTMIRKDGCDFCTACGAVGTCG